jgi:hypothetical protein
MHEVWHLAMESPSEFSTPTEEVSAEALTSNLARIEPILRNSGSQRNEPTHKIPVSR